MSGIYIPNMQMPTDDYDDKMEPTAVWVYPNGYAVVFKDRGRTQQYTRAIPVPNHGRLIDADALRQSIKESIDECHKWADEVSEGEMYARVSQSLGTFVECSLRIKAAPTIIPADGKDGAE